MSAPTEDGYTDVTELVRRDRYPKAPFAAIVVQKGCTCHWVVFWDGPTGSRPQQQYDNTCPVHHAVGRSPAEQRIGQVLEAIREGREHGSTSFDLDNLERMLTQ